MSKKSIILSILAGLSFIGTGISYLLEKYKKLSSNLSKIASITTALLGLTCLCLVFDEEFKPEEEEEASEN